MMRRPILLAVVAAGMMLAAIAHGADESLLRSLSRQQGLYQQRLRALQSNDIAPPFSGSASVVPDRAQSAVVSIGVAGVPQQLGHYCGAVAIAPHWILTASHCVSTVSSSSTGSGVTPLDPSKLQVLAGTQILYSGGKVVPVSRIVLHPEYRVTAQGVPVNDLALLQFSEALPGRPATLASDALAAQSLREGQLVVALGWGTAAFSSEAPISTTLLYAAVDVVGRQKCNQAYDGLVTDGMFCAGLGAADSCKGDSGGPAVAFDKEKGSMLVGVISWGVGCSRQKYPGVYVDLVKYRSWIDGTIGKKQ
jgi:trypsin